MVPPRWITDIPLSWLRSSGGRCAFVDWTARMGCAHGKIQIGRPRTRIGFGIRIVVGSCTLQVPLPSVIKDAPVESRMKCNPGPFAQAQEGIPVMFRFLIPSRQVIGLATCSRAMFFVCGLALATCQLAHTQAEIGTDDLHRSFLNPPDDARIMVRWWWFGPAATKPELTRELEQMKTAGIGGVEIANLYPLALDDPKSGFRNTPFLSDEHLETLRFAAQEARRLGLRVDMTLCSGWPFGDPEIGLAPMDPVHAERVRQENVSPMQPVHPLRAIK